MTATTDTANPDPVSLSWRYVDFQTAFGIFLPPRKFHRADNSCRLSPIGTDGLYRD
ncbi:hypothetical protein [Novosphingobium sp. KA1]|uniref:hypothetical protein n=1 Tax=Novosphingobium sp. (strain KA1) TaxID=164608 RepID=UPI001A8F0A73|nr:hypothetical protein [Novosphingobium sp. KA1]